VVLVWFYLYYDVGVGVVRRRPNKRPLAQNWIDVFGASPISMLESDDITTFRTELLNLMNVDQFLSWLDEETS
jgi:hypothetical protein